MKAYFTIDECFGMLYEVAIKNTLANINAIFGTKFTYRDNFEQADYFARTYGIRYDAEGKIIGCMVNA